MLEFDWLNQMLKILPDYHYCENNLIQGAGKGHFQPLNFLTNLVLFFYACFYYLRSRFEGETMGKYLVVAMIFLSLSSFAWHGFYHPFFLLWDIVGVLIVTTILIQQFAMRCSENHKPLTLWLCFIVLFVFVIGNLLIPLEMHAGGFFLVGVGFLGLSLVHSVNLAIDKMHHSFIWIGKLITFAAIFRSADSSLCELLPWPIGTHFIWHIAIFTAVIVAVEHMRYIPLKKPIQ